MNKPSYDPSYLDAAIVTAIFVFLTLAFAHWIMGCSNGYSCESNADCPVGAFCDPTQPNGPICVPVDVRADAGEDGGDPLVAYPTRWVPPDNPLCPICVSASFPVGCVIGKDITCVGAVEDCSGNVCLGVDSDSGMGSSDAGSDSGSDAGTTGTTTDSGPPLPTACDLPICTYSWCGTSYNNNCPLQWNGGGDGCDCGCQFYDTDCGG